MNKNLLLICFLSLWLAQVSRAQRFAGHPSKPRLFTPDTVFVYDTLYLIDTIRIMKPLAPVSVLRPADPAMLVLAGHQGEKNLIIFSGLAATFRQDSIMFSEQIINLKNSEKMKKIGFFSVILFSFQNMVLAQHDIGFNAGASLYHLNTNLSPQLHSKNAAAFNVGISYSHAFAHGKLSWNADLNYHYLLRSDFDSVAVWGTPASVLTGEDFSRNYHMINLPLSIQWNTPWFCPVLGAEMYFKQSPRIALVRTDSQTGDVVTSHYRVPYYGASWFAGALVPLSERLGIRLRYFKGLTREHTAQINGGQLNTKMDRWELSVRYRLK